ncbi:hypothetical protein GmHk_02G003839 [Glycine max]|nr:hypothetical protein GmHk_02G003839 [Glycine max]
MACSPWPMFVDYVKETWIIPHKEKFVSAWTNKVMHLGNTTTNMVEFAHSSLKKLLQNSLGDLCSVWDAMNNMIMLQHTKIKASFETSTHVVGHVFKKTLYRRLLGMVSRYAKCGMRNAEWMQNAKCRRTSPCSRWHTALAQRRCHLL